MLEMITLAYRAFLFACRFLLEQSADQIWDLELNLSRKLMSEKSMDPCMTRTLLNIRAAAYLLRNPHTERRKLRISNR